MRSTRVPWSYPDSKSPICFPTASAYDEYMADDEDSETVSKNTEVAYDCCLETPDEYMADDEDSETVSKNAEVIYFFFHIFQKFYLSLIHRLFLVTLPHLLFPTFCD